MSEEIKKTRPTIAITLPEKSNYFATVNKEGIEMFSSGCQLLDCVLGGGWVLGRMSNIVGDKSSSKTLLAIEACVNFLNKYSNGQVYYLEAEAAFDLGYAEAIGMPVDSITFIDCEGDNTVEFLHEYLMDITLKVKVPTLFIVDSLDALSDRSEKEREIDKGTYAMGKQKKMSEMFRRLIKPLEKSTIHLMIISQVRENIGVTFGEKYTRSGGKAMDFYATHILWLAEIKKLKKTIKGIDRVIGIMVKANCKKNKIGLPFRTCEYPVYFGYGVDDIEAGITFLETCKELHTVSAKLGIGINDTDKLTPAQLKSIKKIMEDKEEAKKLRTVLNSAIVTLWQDIEKSFLPKSSKY
jgi:recombination protein RecA